MPRPRLALVSAFGALLALASVVACTRFDQGAVESSARIGYREDPPSMMTAPDGRPRGVGVDVVAEAARRAGIAVQWIKLAQGDTPDAALREARIDIHPILIATQERQREFFLTTPWFEADVWIMLRPGASLPTASSTGRIGVGPVPVTAGGFRQFLFPKATPVPFGDTAALMRGLCDRSVDVVLVDPIEVAALRVSEGEPCNLAALRTVRLPSARLSGAMAAREAFRGTANRLRAEIDAMVRDGTAASLALPYSYSVAADILAVHDRLESEANARAWRYGTLVLGALLLVTAGLLAALHREHRRAANAFAETLALQEQLRTAQRLEIVGQMAGSVAHDFNNLVTVIVGYTELARSAARSLPGLQETLDEIHRAGDRASELVRQLLAFSGHQAGESRVLALEQELSDLQPMLRRVLRENISLVFRQAGAPDHVRMDAGDLSRVLLNLAVNAADAMPEGGTLTVSTRGEPGDGARDGVGWFHVVVEDTGAGMPPEVLARAFEPFFTTKGPGRGTGLGLASVHGIVSKAGGRVTVESTPGTGTRFDIRLPLTADAPEVRAAQADRRVDVGAHTLLVVEDQADVRALVVRVLEARGYRVRAADHALEALAILREPGASISLVLSDLVMPGMSGRSFFERAKAEHGPLRFLFMSGYSDEALAAGEGRLLPKPFTPGQLVDAVQRALAAGAPSEPRTRYPVPGNWSA